MANFITVSLTMMIFLSCQFQFTHANYVLEIWAHTYQNSRSRDSNDDCCDALIVCVGECDNQFIFCLRGTSTANDGNTNNCPLGSYCTGEIGDDSFTFSTPISNGVPNPMIFSGNIWPVRRFIKCQMLC